MSQICQVTGKQPMVGNRVSHAKNRSKHRFKPNIHLRRFWVAEEQRYVRLKVSTQGIRIIDRDGIEAVLKRLRDEGQKV